MIAKAIAKYIRIGPKKARLVADEIRGKRVDQAMNMLPNINKKMSSLALDILKSAYANAKFKYPDAGYDESGLYISKITVDEGPSLKRFRAASMGRASNIKKRTSHVCIELDVVPVLPNEKKQAKAADKKTIKKTTEKKSETVAKKKTVKKTSDK